MSLSKQNRRSRSAVILVALCTLSARAADSTRPDDYVTRARQFLRVLYPGIDGRLRPVVIGHRLRDPAFVSPDAMNFFTMLLYDFELAPGGGPVIGDWSAPAVTAQFAFNLQTDIKELDGLTIGGPAIDGAASKFAVEFAKQGEWSEAKISVAMKEAGAKFGPDHKAEFLRAFPREQLKPFVGGDLEVVSAEFYFDRNPSAHLPPRWVVQAKWHAFDGRESDCMLAFEPFRGYVTSISLM